MTSLEDRVRLTLLEMSAEAQPVDFLPRLDDAPARAGNGRRLALVAAAAAVAAVVAVGSLLLLRPDRPSVIEPVERPPKVFRLSGETVTAPGQAQIVVFSAQLTEGQGTAHVHRVTGGRAVTLATSEWVPFVYSQQLSQDGTRIIRQHSYTGDPRLEIVNLATGATNRLGGHRGFCPRLSPDNRTVAVFAAGLVFLDARTGDRLPGGHRGGGIGADSDECPSIGWAPDGRRLVLGGRTGSLVLDDRGRTLSRLANGSPVNADMSWAPDGQSILMYDWKAERNVILDVSSGSESALRMPPEAVRPLGWAGSRIVWLVGQPGDQRLVTTDQTGRDPRPWMRLEIGGRAVETVQWPSDLSGTAAD